MLMTAALRALKSARLSAVPHWYVSFEMNRVGFVAESGVYRESGMPHSFGVQWRGFAYPEISSMNSEKYERLVVPFGSIVAARYSFGQRHCEPSRRIAAPGV